MADETEVLPVPKVELEPISRWTTEGFKIRLAALTPVNTRKAQGVDRGETRALVNDMCEAISERDRALKAEVDAGTRLKIDRGGLRRTLRERDEQIARMRGEDPGMGGLPVRAVSEVMGATRYGEQGAELILDDARRKAGVIVADAKVMQGEARRLLDRAHETAAAGPPELVLPSEPRLTGDVLVDAELQAAHIVACKEAFAEHRQALEGYRARIDEALAQADVLETALDVEEVALGERRDGIVASLDEMAARVPEVRQRVIDLTERSDVEAKGAA